MNKAIVKLSTSLARVRKTRELPARVEIFGERPNVNFRALRQGAQEYKLYLNQHSREDAHFKALALGGTEIPYSTGGGGGMVEGVVSVGALLLPQKSNVLFAFATNNYSEFLVDACISVEYGRTWLLGFNPTTGTTLRYRAGERWINPLNPPSKRDLRWFISCVREAYRHPFSHSIAKELERILAALPERNGMNDVISSITSMFYVSGFSEEKPLTTEAR